MDEGYKMKVRKYEGERKEKVEGATREGKGASGYSWY
jgi:hypothetical protein